MSWGTLLCCVWLTDLALGFFVQSFYNKGDDVCCHV